ncbi:MAG: hypothetical protein WCC06_08460 [Candidatus Aminicenantales bacterium]
METTKKEKVFQVTCPSCQTVLWVDARTQELLKSEKGAKKKESLDDLLLRERKKAAEYESRFEATAELEKKKREEAEKKFQKAFSGLDETEEPD